MRAIGYCRADEVVALIQIHGDDARFAWIREVRQRGFLHRTETGCHKDVFVLGKTAAIFGINRQHHGDFFALFKRQHANNRRATRSARACGDFIHARPIQATAIREAENRIVGVGNEQVFNPVLFAFG